MCAWGKRVQVVKIRGKYRSKGEYLTDITKRIESNQRQDMCTFSGIILAVDVRYNRMNKKESSGSGKKKRCQRHTRAG